MSYFVFVENMTNEIRLSPNAIVKSIPKHPHGFCTSKINNDYSSIVFFSLDIIIIIFF